MSELDEFDEVATDPGLTAVTDSGFEFYEWFVAFRDDVSHVENVRLGRISHGRFGWKSPRQRTTLQSG